MKNWIRLLFCTVFVFLSCQRPSGIGQEEFEIVMNNVAEGWSTQNTKLALSSFTEDAIYMEPPNIQYYRGHEQLKPYFDELTDVHKMVFHRLWFDSDSQTGAGEFTFIYGKDTADTGIAVVELQNGRIKFWREYHKKGPVDFKKYISVENKTWDWHIGNYPEPKDSLNLKQY